MSNTTHKNKFGIGELVVAVPRESNLGLFVEGVVAGIYTNMDGEVLYEIECDNPLNEGRSKLQFRVAESRTFGSRLDMYIWKVDYIKSMIADLRKELGEVNQAIREEKEYAKDCGEDK